MRSSKNWRDYEKGANQDHLEPKPIIPIGPEDGVGEKLRNGDEETSIHFGNAPTEPEKEDNGGIMAEELEVFVLEDPPTILLQGPEPDSSDW